MSSDPTGEVMLEMLVRDVVQQAGVPDWEDEVLRVVRFCVTSEALDRDAASAAEGVYDLRLGGWSLEGRRAAVQAMITGAILAVAARQAGLDSYSVTILALVLPFIVDVEHVELLPSEQTVLAELRATGQSGAEADLYAGLPRYVRDQLTELEFRDVLQRLEDAGQVTRTGPDTVTPAARRKRLRLPLHRL